MLVAKNLAFLSLMAKVQGMVCTGAVSQIVKTYSSGQIHYRNMHHGFYWKVSFWCDDWWFLNLHKKISLSEATIALQNHVEDKNADMKSIFSLALIHVLNKNNITGLPIAWIAIMLKYLFYNLNS